MGLRAALSVTVTFHTSTLTARSNMLDRHVFIAAVPVMRVCGAECRISWPV
jgi:hypothetical protein